MRTHSRSEWASSTFKIWLYTCLASSALFSPLVSAEESKTPLAGEAFQTEVKGREIDVLTRRRRSITAVDFGVLVNPKCTCTQEVLTHVSFFVWPNAVTRRSNGTFSGPTT